MRIWLYAGNPEYPALLVGESAGSDNATGADNQQERPVRFERESSETIRQMPSELEGDEMVPSAWRHAGSRIKGV